MCLCAVYICVPVSGGCVQHMLGGCVYVSWVCICQVGVAHAYDIKWVNTVKPDW